MSQETEWFQHYLVTEERERQEGRWRDWVDAVAVVVTAMVIVFLFSGCASQPVPECEKYQAYIVQSQRGPLFVLDMENAAKLAQMMKDVQAGKCKLADA